MTAASLADLLFAPAEPPEPDASAVVDAETDTTWTQLAERAEAIGVKLRDAGVETGMPVAVQLADSAMLVATIFGVWRAGGVYVPINPRSTASERARVFDVVQPAVHITMDDGALHMDRVEGETARHDAGVALVQMTSGTTGRPKPVLLTHAGVLELMDGVLRKIRGGAKREAGAERPMPNLIPVSLSLWAGIYNVLFAFRVGAAVVLLGAFEPQRFAELVDRYQVKSTVLPPAAMTMLTNDDAIADLAPLRFVRSITAPLSPLEAARFHDKFGIAILNSYGQTEIGGEIIGWNAADSREFGASKLGALGRPHDGVHVAHRRPHWGAPGTHPCAQRGLRRRRRSCRSLDRRWLVPYGRHRPCRRRRLRVDRRSHVRHDQSRWAEGVPRRGRRGAPPLTLDRGCRGRGRPR